MNERVKKVAQWIGFPVAALAVPTACGALITGGGALLGTAGALGAMALVALLVLAFVLWGPGLFMEVFTKSLDEGPYRVSERAQALHRKLFVADMHADALMWRRDLLRRDRRGHVDVPRLIEGNVALQIFTATTKAPVGMNLEATPDNLDMVTALCVFQRWPRATWGSLKERALYMGEKLHRFAEGSCGRLRILKSRADIEAYLVWREENPASTAGLLGIQGAHALEGDLGNVDLFFDAGFRLIGLTHFFDNEVGGSAHGIRRRGLTEFGADLVRAMEARGMIVDLAHAAPRLIDDVLALAAKPVMVSHTGVMGTLVTPRNLSDAHVQAIAECGGIIGIGYWSEVVGPGGVDAVVRAMQYAVDLVGTDAVGLGSDFDGFVPEPFDTSGLAVLTEALLNAGFSEDDTAKIMGGNLLRFLRRLWERPPGERSQNDSG